MAPQPTLSAQPLLETARGLSTLFWSVLATLLLAAAGARFQASLLFYIRLFPISILAACFGLSRLKRAGWPGSDWARRARHARLAFWLVVYFTPFLFCWFRTPRHPFFLVNMAGFVASAAWLELAVLHLCEHIGGLCSNRTLRAEARLCQAFVRIAAAAVVLFLIMLTALSATSLAREWLGRAIIRLIPSLVRLTLLPAVFSLAVFWRTKDTAFHLLSMISSDGTALLEDMEPRRGASKKA